MANFGTWPEFLDKVDDTIEDSVVVELVPKLVAAGWKKPGDVVGALPAELVETMPSATAAPVKALLRRVVEEAQAVHADFKASQVAGTSQALVPIAASQGTTQQQPEMMTQLQSLLGTEHSALTVAQAISTGVPKPSVATMLLESNLQHIPDEFCPDEESFVAVYLDGQVAKTVARKAFTFVELTHVAVLPDYLPPESVGGKTAMAGDECLQGYTGNLGQLGQALKSLTTAPRCFRNISQWSAAFLRYGIVAVACKQVDLGLDKYAHAGDH